MDIKIDQAYGSYFVWDADIYDGAPDGNNLQSSGATLEEAIANYIEIYIDYLGENNGA